MLKRINLEQLLFNEYSIDGYLDLNARDWYANVFVDNDFEIIEKGLGFISVTSPHINESNLYNTCILQPEENEQFIEFRAINNSDGTFTYMILRPVKLAINSYVPVFKMEKAPKNKNVYDITINNEAQIIDTLTNNISSDKITLQKILAYFEILRIKLLVKESLQENGYTVESVIKVLAHNTFGVTYTTHIDFHKNISYYINEVDKDQFSDMFDTSATLLVIKNKFLGMPIDEALFVHGKIFIMVDVSKESRNKDLCVVTLGENSIFSKIVWGENKNVCNIVKNTLVAEREEMIEMELNPHLRNLFKLINKSK